MESSIQDYIAGLQHSLSTLCLSDIRLVAERLHEARLSRRQVFVVGNGGSASTASHIVCDLAKNTRNSSAPHFKIIELADNTAVFSAYANDEGYENAMARHLANFVEQNDVVLGISTSGNSPNILRAIDLAKAHGATTIGFTGFDGGQLLPRVDLKVHVASDCIEHVEDIHLVLGHVLTTYLREMARAQPIQ